MKKLFLGLLSILVITLIMYSCEKDNENFTNNSKTEVIKTRSVSNTTVTDEEISTAKQLFQEQLANISNMPDDQKGPFLDEWKSIIPIWNQSESALYYNYHAIIIPTVTGMQKSKFKLIYFHDDNGSEYLYLFEFWNDGSNNTGAFLSINTNGYPEFEVLVKNGHPYEIIVAKNITNDTTLTFRGGIELHIYVDPCDLCPVACPCVESFYNVIEDNGCFYGREIAQGIKWRCDCAMDGTDDDGENWFGNPDIDHEWNDNGNNGDGNSNGGNGNNTTFDDLIKKILTDVGDIDEIMEDCEIDPLVSEIGFNALGSTDEKMNLPAVALFQIHGDKLFNALYEAYNKYDNGEYNSFENALFDSNNVANGTYNYDKTKPLDKAIYDAITILKDNVNNANGDCSQVFTMSTFFDTFNTLYDNELSNLLNNELDINCDIKNIFNTKAKKAIRNLIDNNDFSHQCNLPDKTTKEILSDIVNESCSDNFLSKKDLYDKIVDKLNGEILNWHSATDYEKIDRIIHEIQLQRWYTKCIPSHEAILDLNKLFEHLPLNEVHGSHIPNSCVGVSTDASELDVKIQVNFSFLPIGDRKLYLETYKERDNGTNTIIGFVYYGNKYASNPYTALSIILPDEGEHVNIFHSYVLETNQWKCPKK